MKWLVKMVSCWSDPLTQLCLEVAQAQALELELAQESFVCKTSGTTVIVCFNFEPNKQRHSIDVQCALPHTRHRLWRG